jgi:hypothetical protein
VKEESRESPSGRSMLSLYAKCPRSWAFKYLKGFKEKDTADHLTYGSVVHEAQEAFYLNDFSLPDAKARITELLGKDHKLYEKAIKAITIWEEKLGSYDRENCKVLEVEQEAYLTLPNGFVMTIRRDRVLEDCLVDEVFVGDTKTTGYSLEGAIDKYMKHDQPILYLAEAKQNEPEWLDRLSGWRTDCIYNKGSVWKVQRAPVSSFTADEIIDVMLSYAALTSDLAYKINSVLLDGDSISSQFYCNKDRCFDYFKPCPYLNFCHEIDQMDLPPANFEIDEWLADGTVIEPFKKVES